MSRVLSVFAHPDDELLFGWPVLQDRGFQHHVLIVAARDERRRRPLETVAGLYGFGLEALDLEPCFGSPLLRSETDYHADRERIQAAIERAAGQFQPDFLFTHNILGEYGHADHCFLNGLVRTMFAARLPVLFTDLYCPIRVLLAEGWSTSRHGAVPDRAPGQLLQSGVVANETLLEAGIAAYQEHGVFTWHESWVPRVASVYCERPLASSPEAGAGLAELRSSPR